METILPILYGAMFRQADGRSGRPMMWNLYLYIGLPVICVQLFGNTPQAYAIAVITAVSLLCGYKSFTWPWVVYGIKKLLVIIYHIKAEFIHRPTLGIKASQALLTFEFHVEDLEKGYNVKTGGFSSFHTSYRFLIPSLIICLMTGFNWYWLAATVIAGALFPLSVKYWETEPAAQLREAILGGVLIGGLAFL